NLHYIPVYRQPYYEKMGYNRSDFPESEQYYSEAISIPMYPSLTEEEQQEVVHRLITPIGHQTLF
ncbi:DegT/DnrJ/EryC1/StrS family aminotransferase, partial [Leptospira santarosai]